MQLRDSVERGTLQVLASQCHFEVRQLTRCLGISQRQLQRHFKAELRCTPQAWLREQRLQTARQMLQSAYAVKQVAHTLAFPSESQFSRDFKARFGHSPSEDMPKKVAVDRHKPCSALASVGAASRAAAPTRCSAAR